MHRAAIAFILLCLASSASGQSDFYAGRTVSILVGSGPGGLTDTSAHAATAIRFVGHIRVSPERAFGGLLSWSVSSNVF